MAGVTKPQKPNVSTGKSKRKRKSKGVKKVKRSFTTVRGT